MRHVVGRIAFALGLCVAAFRVEAQGHEGHRDISGEHRLAEDKFAVDGSVAPRLRIELVTMDGGQHQLRLIVENFKFVPEQGSSPRIVGEGHAHLYVDRMKIGRLFEPTHLIPKLAAGVHEIAVDLVTSDHAIYTVSGIPVTARIILRSNRTANSRPAARAVTDLSVSLAGGETVHDQRRSRTLQVKQGDTVRIHWRSDALAQLHLHGYDIQATVAPGVPTTMQFDADIAGRFSIASHGDGRRGGHAHRGLIYLEVQPK